MVLLGANGSVPNLEHSLIKVSLGFSGGCLSLAGDPLESAP